MTVDEKFAEQVRLEMIRTYGRQPDEVQAIRFGVWLALTSLGVFIVIGSLLCAGVTLIVMNILGVLN